MSAMRVAATSPLSRLLSLIGQARRLASLVSRTRIERARWVLEYVEGIHGGYRSAVNQIPVNHVGEPLPWYTYPAIEFLAQLDFARCDVFEYGSGSSSEYWARRARSVRSVESDDAWYEVGRRNLASNRQLLFRTVARDYVQAIVREEGPYHVVIVDGDHRRECAAEACRWVKEGGMVLLDNADWLPQTAAALRGAGLTQFDFIGLGPLNSYAWCTSIFLKGQLTIPRIHHERGPLVLGGIAHLAASDRTGESS